MSGSDTDQSNSEGKQQEHSRDVEVENLEDFLILFDPSTSANVAINSSQQDASPSEPCRGNQRKRERSSDKSGLVRGQSSSECLPLEKIPRTSRDNGVISKHGQCQQQLETEVAATLTTMSSSPLTKMRHPFNSFNHSPPLQQEFNVWTEKAVEQVLASMTDPVGRFLRDIGVNAKDAIRLNIMPHLDQAPRKQRCQYGKRKDLPLADRQALNRERNKEHAKSTRQRRKVFETVLDQQLRKLGQAICASFTSDHTTRYLQRRNRRVENLVSFFLLMDSSISPDTPVSWQYCLTNSLVTHVQLQSELNLQLYDRGMFSTSLKTENSGPKAVQLDHTVTSRENSTAGQDATNYASIAVRPLQRLLDIPMEKDLPQPCPPPTPAACSDNSMFSPQIDLLAGVSEHSINNLPLLLPLSPPQIRFMPLPTTMSYPGYDSLSKAMKNVLDALQKSVYNVLQTNKFYRKIYEVFVPESAAINASTWTKSSSMLRCCDEKSDTCMLGSATETLHSVNRDLPLLWSNDPGDNSHTISTAVLKQIDSTSSVIQNTALDGCGIMSTPLFLLKQVKTDNRSQNASLLCYPDNLDSPRHCGNGVNSDDGQATADVAVSNDEHRASFSSCQHGHGGESLSPNLSDRASDYARASINSDNSGQKQFMQQNPPPFSLEHLIPINVKFHISCTKNDLLVQGTKAICSFDVEIWTKLPNTSMPVKCNDESKEQLNESEVGDGIITTRPTVHVETDTGDGFDRDNLASESGTPPTNHSSTVVSVPGSFASFSFEPDRMGAHKIFEAFFDLDMDALALNFLDHVQILHDYFQEAFAAERKSM